MKDKFRLFIVLTSLILTLTQALKNDYVLSLAWLLSAGLHLAFVFLANDRFKAAVLSGLSSFLLGLIAIFLEPVYRTHLFLGWFLLLFFASLLFYHQVKIRKERKDET